EKYMQRNKIINIINKILELKDKISPDDHTNQFYYNVKNIKIKRTYITKKNKITLKIIERFELIINVNEEIYEQSRLFTLFVFEELIKIGFLSIDEVNEITLSVLKNYKSLNTKESILFIKRKLGVCFYYVLSNEPEILLDNSLIELTRIRMGDILEKIKKLN
ncbi:DUF4004 family protein, partial [Clostridium botulinum]|nr:DUF4004 family protein [Clostridium botulinum]